MKVRQHIRSQLDLFVNNMSDFFAETDHSFQSLEERFFNFCAMYNVMDTFRFYLTYFLHFLKCS